MCIQVNVVDAEIRLAVGQHSRKIYKPGVLPDDVQEEILLRHGVEAVSIKRKPLSAKAVRAGGLPFRSVLLVTHFT